MNACSECPGFSCSSNTSLGVCPVRPFSFSSSAIARKESKSSWQTFASPNYRKSRIEAKSFDWNPLRYNRGWGCLLFWSIFSKNGLEDAKMTLWASICWPSSHTRVTSVNPLSPRSFPKAELTFSLKFHCKQSFSDILAGELFFVLVGLYNQEAFDVRGWNPTLIFQLFWILYCGENTLSEKIHSADTFANDNMKQPLGKILQKRKRKEGEHPFFAKSTLSIYNKFSKW